jgi:hypothetical protein
MVASPTVVDAPRSKGRRWLWRGLLAIVVVLVLGAIAALVAVRVAFSGHALASRVCAQLNADMRGRVRIASIDWPMSALPRVVRGGWVPVTLHDVELRDADGIVVFRSARMSAELDAHAVMFGAHDLIARHVVIDGGDVRLRQVPASIPLFAGDTTISLLAAFESPTRRTGATASASRGPRIDVRDADARSVALTIETENLGRIDVARVSTHGALFYDPRRATPLLTYAVAPMTTGGTWRIREQTIAIERLDIRELVETASDARFALLATLERGVTIDATIVGPLDEDPRIDATIRGLAYDDGRTPSLHVAVAPVHVVHDLATGEGHLDELVARGAGGSVRTTARWSGGVAGTLPTQLTGDFAIVEPLDAGPWLRRDAIRELGRHVSGSLDLALDRADGVAKLTVSSPILRTERLTVDRGTLAVDGSHRVRVENLRFRVPGLAAAYDCTGDLGPPLSLDCTGLWKGDGRVLMRLSELDPW